MSSNNLLVELFVEELPPKVLKKLGESFAGSVLEKIELEKQAQNKKAAA